MTAPTTLAVQPGVYYTAAGALHTAAGDLWGAVSGAWGDIAACAHMAGTYDDGKTWAQSYDGHAWDALDAATTLASTMDSYAATLREMGHTHAMAEWTVTIGAKGTAPAAPPTPPPAVSMCKIPPPSAGGPGSGLDEAVHLAAKIGIVVPDGDTSKLGAVGDAWAALAADHAVSGLADDLGRIKALMDTMQSPEIEFVNADLERMRGGARSVVAGMCELATACHEHAAALGDLRAQLRDKLEELGKELLKELAVTAAIGIAASVVTFGIGAAVASARMVEIAATFARPIRAIIDAWKAARGLGRGAKVETDLAGSARGLRELAEEPEYSTEWGGAPKMTDEQRWTLMRGPSRDLIRSLRRGDDLTPEQQKELNALNNAMDKAPIHQGPVRRDIELTPQELAAIKPGEPYSPGGFMNSSTNPAGVNASGMENTTNTTFKILSKTGRDVSDLGGTSDEIAFKTTTKYFVKSAEPDPVTGRMIIELLEM